MKREEIIWCYNWHIVSGVTFPFRLFMPSRYYTDTAGVLWYAN